MPDFRVHCPAARPDDQQLRLSPEESHHLVVVNRCGRGDPVVVFDGHGREWLCSCTEPNKTTALLLVREHRAAPPRLTDITLAQALPKGATMDDIVRQATEIGAARIVPLLSERTQVQIDPERADKKVDKWRTTAVEAAKQCGNPWLPEITPVQTLRDFVRTVGDYDLKLIASLHPGAISLKTALAQYREKHPVPPRRVLWLVGPEGDLTPAEIATLVSTGFTPITLGPLVLRCDTAATVALGILTHELTG